MRMSMVAGAPSERVAIVGPRDDSPSSWYPIDMSSKYPRARSSLGIWKALASTVCRVAHFRRSSALMITGGAVLNGRESTLTIYLYGIPYEHGIRYRIYSSGG
ncbi:hypothetical protein H113_04259 [Trichophyton rubrum MR1459]|uniref:Uncharacterized protein n=1 Tax=Trichophyton rubrum (strain ATCC MYA-4607 / CBS 118892) TaxID=559305 RepID=A0A080WG99_TRIRC|nr:uncharacterized protein TERG_12091 [Trichophyton rubrum CBS 118892]EZF95429.1 hypothetical protein H113_04259 [Trichophyton rubrum MR1459]EZG06257.1 hypothetical protein H106_04042 [Trichophyton rubrum CBS 735.88]KFL61441.1 hypothetical protein TERG_12091 [Trichophyton rubrum CBS 118892]